MCFRSISSVLFFCFLLTGCLPVYHPIDIQKTVVLKGSGYVNLRICHDGKWYVLEDENGVMYIPYGRRITLSDNHVEYGSQVKTWCEPFINFIPKKGDQYYVNYNEDQDSCSLEVLRYSGRSRMAPDETAKGGVDC